MRYSRLLSVILLSSACTLSARDVGNSALTDSNLVGTLRAMLGRQITANEFNHLKTITEAWNISLPKLSSLIFQEFPDVQQQLDIPFVNNENEDAKLSGPTVSEDMNAQSVNIKKLNPDGVTILDSDFIGAMQTLLGRSISSDELSYMKYLMGKTGSRLDRLARRVVQHMPEAQQHLDIPVGCIDEQLVELDCKNGVKLWGLSSDMLITQAIKTSGIWEPSLEGLARKLIRPGDYVVDAGSNLGYHTGVFAQCVGSQGKVFAIDALPVMTALNEKMKTSNGFSWVDVFNYAIGDVTGEAHCQINCLIPGKSSLISAEEATRLDSIKPGYIAHIPMMPMDEMFLDLPKLSFIKIDVEGVEGLAIKGAAGIINKFKPTIVLEYTPKWLQSAGINPKAFLDQFIAKGYRIGILNNLAGEKDPRAALLNSPQVSTKKLLQTAERRIQVDLVFIHKG